MIFKESRLPGAFVIEPELLEDERGFFARTWCRREFESQDLAIEFVQSNISGSRARGTLRGMHYQAAPHEEDKLIRCTRGAVHDVIIDLRRGSRTFMEHVAVRLTAEDRKMVYVPKGFAHGFLTLEDDTEVSYLMSEFFAPDHARGVRWDDPAFAISWPGDVRVISERDRTYPDFAGGGPA